jgi:hypothetical protein
VKRESHVARPIVGIHEFVRTCELYLVRAVPEKALPTVVGVQRRIHATFLKGERDITPIVDGSQSFFTILNDGNLAPRAFDICGGRRRLFLWRAP